jgi:hypothetical protein
MDVAHVGAAGADEGCDISATKDGRRWICQCKRVAHFGPRAVELELIKICQCPESNQPDDVLFVTACNITAATRARARKTAGRIRCHFWAETDLDARVKEHRDILSAFFDPPGHEPDPFFAQFGLYLFTVPRLAMAASGVSG